MRVIDARNVNEAYAVGLNFLDARGVRQTSRNGPVLVAKCPVTTVYHKPQERVLFNQRRNCNPFFHLMEGLWMLAGRRDVEWIGQFNSTFKQFSDDGIVFNAAYGWRWRTQFGYDQIQATLRHLQEKPDTRQAVIAMWDGKEDLLTDSIDRPCNLNICFRIFDGALHMTVNNRSNDAIWGAYGANAVHMSMLQEYMAACLGLKMGTYYQVSNNFHVYEDILNRVGIPDPHPMDPYDMGEVNPLPMVTDPRTFDVDLLNFMDNTTDPCFYSNTFFQEVAVPMALAWTCQKEGAFAEALSVIDRIPHCDWKIAASMWVKRKMEKQRDKRARDKQAKRRVSND